MTVSHQRPLPIPLKLEDFVQPHRTSLVLWDMQKGLAGRAPDVERVKSSVIRLIDAADAAGVLVVWSRHILPPLDLTSGPFLRFLMHKQKVEDPAKLKPFMQEGMSDTDYLDGLAPASDHLVIEKSMPSLFVDTPLDIRLKARGIDSLVLCGVATDIGVEFTARHAMTKGYYSVIAEDATAAYTDEAQARSIAFMRGWFPVVQSQEICAHWRNREVE